jgi:hypothetical protein
MKSLSIIFSGVLLSFILSALTAFPQENIQVTIKQAQMSKGNYPCYSVKIPQAELKSVQQNWVKKLQEGNKIKVKEVDQELTLIGALKPELTPDSVNIFSLLVQTDSAVTLNMFIEIDSVFFGPKDDKTDLASDKTDNSIRNYIRAFAVEQYKQAVTDELEAQQKILKDLENDLEKLVKEEENLVKENSDLENNIEASEREIQEIDNNLTLKNQEILAHNTTMQTIVLEADKKAAQDKQKVLEKEKNQLEKSRSKAKDQISDDKSQIEKNEKAIKQSQEDQVLKQGEITTQNELIIAVQNKLTGIK